MSRNAVQLNGVLLPEFDRNKCIDSQGALVFDGASKYDMILGRDFLHKTGIKLDFCSKTVQWLNHSIPMKDWMVWDDAEAHSFLIDHLNDTASEETLDNHAVEIMDAKYEKVDPLEVAARQTQLTPTQRKELGDLLSKYTRLFDGTLGTYPHKKIHL